MKLVGDVHTLSKVKVRLIDSYEIGAALTDDNGSVVFKNLNYSTYNVVIDSVRINRFIYHPSQGIQMAGEAKELVLNVKSYVYSAELNFYKLSSGYGSPVSHSPYSNYLVLIVPTEKLNNINNYLTTTNIIDTLCSHWAIMSASTDENGKVNFSGIPIGNQYTLVLIPNTRTTFIEVALINERSVGYVLRKSFYLN